MRVARTRTCSFSSETLLMRRPSLAWRQKVRWPGGPTVPATNRSGGSNSSSDMPKTLTGSPADLRITRRRRVLRRHEAGQVRGQLVGREEERVPPAVTDRRHRRGVGGVALEVAEPR